MEFIMKNMLREEDATMPPHGVEYHIDGVWDKVHDMPSGSSRDLAEVIVMCTEAICSALVLDSDRGNPKGRLIPVAEMLARLAEMRKNGGQMS